MIIQHIKNKHLVCLYNKYMKQATVRIIDKRWLSTKYIEKISTLANKYRCDIIFNYDGNVANAKSMINLMSIFGQIKKLPATIEILFKGWNDTQEAFDTIISAMKETKFVL